MITTDELLALIDRLEDLLERSDLAELEVQAGELGILLRKPGELAVASGTLAGELLPTGASGAAGSGPRGESVGRTGEAKNVLPADTDGADRAGTTAVAEAPRRTHAVMAPLTGIFYAAPSPGAAPYVAVGAEVVVGQVIGLIEAMKLFNEIKSDAAGRVVRINATDGMLVRAKQPLIEIEPA
jgi:acetyl-CoA carboxylase biotin carboxyl carrier protein